MNYAYTKKINLSFSETFDEVRFAFAEKWFGIVSNIDVSEKIRTKIDSSFQKYTILWVCKPELAYKFLNKEMDLWIFMPCSIAIYEKGNDIYISAWLPNIMLPWLNSEDELNLILNDLTNEIKLIINSID